MEKNAKNTYGLTAVDICMERKKEAHDDEEEEIKQCLELAYTFRAKDALMKLQTNNSTWLENKRNALMVVASLIATMAFQVGINPPGGVWQDDNKDSGLSRLQYDISRRTTSYWERDNNDLSYPPANPPRGVRLDVNDKSGHQHFAGHSIMVDKGDHRFKVLLATNTIGLVTSLSVILLLISGLPYNRLFVVVLMIIIWISISATALTYFISISFWANSPSDSAAARAWAAWQILMLFLLFMHVTRFIVKLIKKQVCFMKKPGHRRFSMGVTEHQPVV